MQTRDAIQPVLEQIAATLQSGHRVWVVGVMDIPKPGAPMPAGLPPPPLEYSVVGPALHPELVVAGRPVFEQPQPPVSRRLILRPSQNVAPENMKLIVADGLARLRELAASPINAENKFANRDRPAYSLAPGRLICTMAGHDGIVRNRNARPFPLFQPALDMVVHGGGSGADCGGPAASVEFFPGTRRGRIRLRRPVDVAGHPALQAGLQHEVSRHLRHVCAHHGAVRRNSGGHSLRRGDHDHADGADALLAGQEDAGPDGGHGGGDQLCRAGGQYRLVRIGGPRHALRGIFRNRRFVFDVESPGNGAVANGRRRGNHVRHGDADETTRGCHRRVGIRSLFVGIPPRQKSNWNALAVESRGVCGRSRAAVGAVFFMPLVCGGFPPVLVLDGGLCAPICFNRFHFRHRLAILVERPLDGFGRFLAVAALPGRICNDLVSTNGCGRRESGCWDSRWHPS